MYEEYGTIFGRLLDLTDRAKCRLIGLDEQRPLVMHTTRYPHSSGFMEPRTSATWMVSGGTGVPTGCIDGRPDFFFQPGNA